MKRRLMLTQTAGCLAALCASRLPGATLRPPAVETRAGKLRGALANGLFVFQGIPYGSAPMSQRFQPPAQPEPWSGVREALQFGPRPPQPLSRPQAPGGYAFPPDLGEIAEDCLRLNLWTPGLRDGRRRPVLVYLHGGAYSSGSANNPLYDGANLCRDGEVVVVTVTHRLNLFGYLYLADLEPDLADSGNVGMLDLVLALEWIRDNIEGFGGDPRRVLLFGQSGGGAKCATLMAMPGAHGLFHRVLTMSGQQVTASRRQSATERTLAVLKALELPPNRSGELRRMPVERLVAASSAAGYYGPVLDGRALPRDPFSPDAPPLSAAIPMILGNTHDETRGLIGVQDPSTFSLDWSTLPAKLARHGQFLGTLDQREVIALYREWYPRASASDLFFAITTDSRSWRGQLIEAEHRAAQPAAAAPTWVYQLNWPSPVEGRRWGAPHTLDIPLFFRNTAAAPRMSGNGPQARRLAARMSRALLAFAQSGNPNHDDLPTWQPYTLSERKTMLFDDRCRQAEDPRGLERKLIEQVPYTQPGT